MLGYCPPPPTVLSELIRLRIKLHNLLKSGHGSEVSSVKSEYIEFLGKATAEEKANVTETYNKFKEEDEFAEAHKKAEEEKAKVDLENKNAGYLNFKF